MVKNKENRYRLWMIFWIGSSSSSLCSSFSEKSSSSRCSASASFPLIIQVSWGFLATLS